MLTADETKTNNVSSELSNGVANIDDTAKRQVDFYLINNSINDARFKLASRLANKLIGLRKKVLVVTDSSDTSQKIDKVMWSYSDTSFVAHDHISEIQDQQNEGNAAVNHITIAELDLISLQTLQLNYDVLINLCPSVPIIVEHFTRIIEIVEADDAAKVAGRLRYTEHKHQGCEIITHPLEI